MNWRRNAQIAESNAQFYLSKNTFREQLANITAVFSVFRNLPLSSYSCACYFEEHTGQ